MPLESEKIMFEIYKEAVYMGRYKVVYFTELQDHNREYEISRAISGEHFFDGFIRAFRKEEAKEAIESVLQRLNSGETMEAKEVERQLKPFLAA